MKPSGRSLDIVVIGLGQAGGNLAAEFNRRGYRGLAFNTAQTDLSSLGAGRLALPESQRVYIGLEGADGAGSDLDYGRECIRRNADRIRQAVTEHAEHADAVVVAAGLGGGTGSSVAELTKVIADLSLPVVTLTTLPHHHESGIAKVNALRGVRDLAESPSDGWVLIDNAGLARLHHDVPIDSYFETINRAIVEPIDVFNRLNDRDATRAIRTLDGEDFRTLLLSGGVLSYHSRLLPQLGLEPVLGCLREALARNPMMPHGSQLADVAYLGLVIEASERSLAESPFSLYEEIAEHLKSETGGAAVYMGLYRQLASDDRSATLRLLCSSRSLPTSIGEMLSEAEREAGTIQHKMQQDVQHLDLGGLETLRLMRRPASRAGRESARAAAKPAPAAARPAAAKLSAIDPTPTQPAAAPSRPARAPASAPPATAPSQVEKLRRLVVGNSENRASNLALDFESEEDATAIQPQPSARAGVPSRGRYESLAKAFRAAKADQKRLYIARELVAAQRSGEALERFYAVEAMARLDPKYFREALTDATRDVDKHVADLARSALATLA